jgi:hypothetical protein
MRPDDMPTPKPLMLDRVEAIHTCAICGKTTNRPGAESHDAALGLSTCSDEHDRILREAAQGMSPSTILLRSASTGHALALRAFTSRQVRKVAVVTVETVENGTNARSAYLTPREARRLAGALLRAAAALDGGRQEAQA